VASRGRPSYLAPYIERIPQLLVLWGSLRKKAAPLLGPRFKEVKIGR
jgi:hypothetical protein